MTARHKVLYVLKKKGPMCAGEKITQQKPMRMVWLSIHEQYNNDKNLNDGGLYLLSIYSMQKK